MNKNILTYCFLFFFLELFFSCSDTLNHDVDRVLDYSKSENWALVDTSRHLPFDVIFIHPTTLFDSTCRNDLLQEEEVNYRTMASIDRQASVFSKSCNVYAPYYKQMSMGCLNNAPSQMYFNTAYDDVEAAFDYYLEYLNQGRPFFIAGHSQGSLMLLSFLSKNHTHIDFTKVISVYAVGYTVTTADLKVIGLPLATDRLMLSAMVTWNTISAGGCSPVVSTGALCVNPLSWDTLHMVVGAEHNIEARIKVFTEDSEYSYLTIPHFTSAEVTASGTLLIPQPANDVYSQLEMPMGEGVYHSYDYDFFYQNIVANVASRCRAYQIMNK